MDEANPISFPLSTKACSVAFDKLVRMGVFGEWRIAIALVPVLAGGESYFHKVKRLLQGVRRFL